MVDDPVRVTGGAELIAVAGEAVVVGDEDIGEVVDVVGTTEDCILACAGPEEARREGCAGDVLSIDGWVDGSKG